MRTIIVAVLVIALCSFIGEKKEIGEKNSSNKRISVNVPKEVSSFSGEMMYVPAGMFTSYTYDTNQKLKEEKQISIQAFYCSKTEITNKQYHLFYDEMVKLVGKDSADFYLPDTTVFEKDLPNGSTEAMVKYYYSHKAYENYPVIGVSWLQAKGYVDWLNYKMEELVKLDPEYREKTGLQHFRIPTEWEWEYAASGGMQRAEYSWGRDLMSAKKNTVTWGGNFGVIKDENGVLIKSESDDAAFFVASAESYSPNEFGLYNMSGNVNEWVGDTYVEEMKTSGFNRDTTSSLALQTFGKYYDATFDPKSDKKIIKGGGYLDGPVWCKMANRRPLSVTSQRSDVGFRVCITFFREFK